MQMHCPLCGNTREQGHVADCLSNDYLKPHPSSIPPWRRGFWARLCYKARTSRRHVMTLQDQRQREALSKAKTVVRPGIFTAPVPDPFEANETIRAEMPINDDLAAYLEENLTAVQQVICKAMSLQIIHGLSIKEAVAEAMREVQ